MKRKKYLSFRWWQFVFPTVILFGGIWFAPKDQSARYSILGFGLLVALYFGWRSMSKSLKAEQQLKKGDILCIYCGYVLNPSSWPQRCPECGEHQTYDEVFTYWNVRAELSTAMEPKSPTD